MMDREQMINHLVLLGWAPTHSISAWHAEHGTIWCNIRNAGSTVREPDRTFSNTTATSWDGIADHNLDLIFAHVTNVMGGTEECRYGS